MKKTTEKQSGLTIDAVARDMATTKVHVLMMIKKGLIPACEVDGEWYVDPVYTQQKPAPEKIFTHKKCQKSSGCSGCH